MKDTRSRFEIRVAAAKRLVMWHFFRNPLKLVLVSEFPKSGGSWFCQLLADAIELPFPRNISPKLEASIMHGHHLYNNRFGKTIGVLRDGRDVMISAYYHFLFENDRNPVHSIQHHRSKLNFTDYDDIEKNLPAFIEYMFTGFAEGRFHFNWSEFVNTYCNNENVHIVKYENLLKQAPFELEKVIQFLDLKTKERKVLEEIVEKYSFKNQSKRKPGEENKKSFLRKGIAGDWKNYFTEKAAEVFNELAGDQLIIAGYESDKNWFKKQH